MQPLGEGMARKKKSASRRKRTSASQAAGFRLRLPAIVRERPLDSFGLFAAGLAAAAVSVNALALQEIKGGAKPAVVVATAAVSSEAPSASNPSLPQSRPDEANMLVREVQSELARRGLYDGPEDGIFGPRTEAAIFDFEIGAGLKPTGRPNPQLLAAMRATNSAMSTSPRVAAVQRVLDQQGFGPVKADGVLGEGTRAAIRRFEASRGLTQRGEINPHLLRELTKVSGVEFH